ncbi:MAG: YggT family protein [Paracoccaceae bacterium]
MQSIFEILLLVLGVARFFIIAHFILSWLIAFQVLNMGQPVVAQIWEGLERLLAPLYDPIRRLLPQMGGLDLVPLVALLAIYAIEIVIRNNAAAFF